ncbi:hypothetical protein NHX12_022999 [Muraenolepis orangiensis]|uniref:Uncharacterized protein n=1 Tax=Muraenolepis orangiensis TaxID=630683 RepID=A0A9Q0EPI4_9TELE|nr:hypothetical protein NHX12_022999 [Muraenolepis orangiensis]
MLVVPEHTYPLICVAVTKGTELSQVVRFGTVNPNATASWFTETGKTFLSSSRTPLLLPWFTWSELLLLDHGLHLTLW